MNILLSLFACMVCFFIPPGLYAAERPYYISVIPMYSPEILWSYYSPFVDYLKKKTGRPFELKLVHDHKALIDGICNREVDFAFAGPAPYAAASDRCEVKPLAVSLGKDGRPYYKAVIFSMDPKIKDLRSLSDKTFGYIHGSTLAHVVPFKLFEEAKVNVRPVRFKRHEKIIEAVLTGKVKAGAVQSSVFERFKGQGLYAIKYSEDIPTFLFFFHSKVDKDVSDALFKALTSLKPQAASGWDEMVKYGFMAPTKEYLKAVEEVRVWTKRFLAE